MLARLRQMPSRTWSDILRQLLIVAIAYGLYELVRGAAGGVAAGRATADASRVIGLERRLHLFVEPAVQAWALHVPGLMGFADVTYLDAHAVVTAGALGFIYLRRPEVFPLVRRAFLIAIALALVGYLAFPTAPPRLMPGFVDAIRRFTGVNAERGPGSVFLNPYAAIPSMHVCFALICGAVMSRVCARRVPRLLWRAYPAAIAVVVVVTANHYLADIVLGAVTAALALHLAARTRPAIRAFDEATA